MAGSGQSSCYKPNRFFWKIFGLWPGSTPIKHYRYYSFFFITYILALYIVALTLNLVYAPKKIDIMIREVIFYFTEWAVVFKVIMIIRMRNKIIEVFKLLDCEQFQGYDEVGKKIVIQNKLKYKKFYSILAIVSNFAFVLLCVPPAIYFMIHGKSDLPVCQYYFLHDDTRNGYFFVWLFYLSLGIYVHMMYNVNIDSFIAGLLSVAIVQFKLIRHNISVIHLESPSKLVISKFSKLDIHALNQQICHYALIRRYCTLLQEIISLTIFIQMCMATCIICVVTLSMVISKENVAFMITYTSIMVTQILVPSWLGTILKYESDVLAFSAYSSDWIPRSRYYKNSLRLFVERAKIPIEITGLEMFPLSLSTFISLVKMAYSFFTLVKKMQERQE